MRNILVKPDLRKFSEKNSCVFSPQLLDSLLSLVELVMCGNSTQSHRWAAFYWSPNVWLIFSFDFGASPNQFVCGYKRKWVQRWCSPSVLLFWSKLLSNLAVSLTPPHMKVKKLDHPFLYFWLPPKTKI